MSDFSVLLYFGLLCFGSRDRASYLGIFLQYIAAIFVDFMIFSLLESARFYVRLNNNIEEASIARRCKQSLVVCSLRVSRLVCFAESPYRSTSLHPLCQSQRSQLQWPDAVLFENPSGH